MRRLSLSGVTLMMMMMMLLLLLTGTINANAQLSNGIQPQLPGGPTTGDTKILNSDQQLLNVDQQRVNQIKQSEEAYKDKTDAGLAPDRQAVPRVEAQIAELKGKFSAPTLKKMLSEPSSQYYVLTHWLAQERDLETQEQQQLGNYNNQIASVREQRDADRNNIYSDQQQTVDDRKAYDRKVWSEQELLDNWDFRHQDRLVNRMSRYGTCGNVGYGAGYGNYGYGGYSGYGGYGGYGNYGLGSYRFNGW